MRKTLLSLVTFFIFYHCQAQTGKPFVKYLVAFKSSDSTYFATLTDTVCIGALDSGSIVKAKVLETITDFPQLYNVIEYNFRSDFSYVQDISRCYNIYRHSPPEGVPSIKYFSQFHLITDPSHLYAPPDSMIALRLPIRLNVYSFSIEERDINGQIENYSERTMASFIYGNSPVYSKGPLCANLYKALGNDDEAKHQLKLYKRKWFFRTSIIVIGYGLLAVSIDSMMGHKLTSMNEDHMLFTALPGVYMANLKFLSPPRYKSRHIQRAVEIHNANLHF